MYTASERKALLKGLNPFTNEPLTSRKEFWSFAEGPERENLLGKMTPAEEDQLDETLQAFNELSSDTGVHW